MNTGELVRVVAKRTGTSMKSVERTLAEVKGLIIEVVSKGGEVSLRGFGKFGARQTRERVLYNPQTHRPFYALGKKSLKLKLFQKFKYSIK